MGNTKLYAKQRNKGEKKRLLNFLEPKCLKLKWTCKVPVNRNMAQKMHSKVKEMRVVTKQDLVSIETSLSLQRSCVQNDYLTLGQRRRICVISRWASFAREIQRSGHPNIIWHWTVQIPGFYGLIPFECRELILFSIWWFWTDPHSNNFTFPFKILPTNQGQENVEIYEVGKHFFVNLKISVHQIY